MEKITLTGSTDAQWANGAYYVGRTEPITGLSFSYPICFTMGKSILN